MATLRALTTTLVRTRGPPRGAALLSTTAVPYTERMKAKGRPVSPHVTQYAFPIAALSSITQRVTGCALSVGLLGVAGVLIHPSSRPASLDCFVQSLERGGAKRISIVFSYYYNIKFNVPYTLGRARGGRRRRGRRDGRRVAGGAARQVCRRTGCALSVGLLGVAGVALAGGDVGAVAATVAASPAAPLAKFAVAFPLTYHFLGAARHVVWDKMPESTLHNDLVAQSSWLVVGGSLVVSAGLAAVSLPKAPPPSKED
eukprot:CAMPEP_0185721974 /NCGR_PEP_ID=MMETSP1164-20130828/50883_1 /TAXON_ID=1104430 /ORGANISM="Chrysoreinhardia sp, Strain CCMP2950" /LENGTH=256 /DNA_ID=CAMNT_0028389637 /DNA_START=57 /DNA_END=826 /DNA_ORIENTATION=+